METTQQSCWGTGESRQQPHSVRRPRGHLSRSGYGPFSSRVEDQLAPLDDSYSSGRATLHHLSLSPTVGRSQPRGFAREAAPSVQDFDNSCHERKYHHHWPTDRPLESHDSPQTVSSQLTNSNRNSPSGTTLILALTAANITLNIRARLVEQSSDDPACCSLADQIWDLASTMLNVAWSTKFGRKSQKVKRKEMWSFHESVYSLQF